MILVTEISDRWVGNLRNALIIYLREKLNQLNEKIEAIYAAADVDNDGNVLALFFKGTADKSEVLTLVKTFNDTVDETMLTQFWLVKRDEAMLLFRSGGKDYFKALHLLRELGETSAYFALAYGSRSTIAIGVDKAAEGKDRTVMVDKFRGKNSSILIVDDLDLTGLEKRAISQTKLSESISLSLVEEPKKQKTNESWRDKRKGFKGYYSSKR